MLVLSALLLINTLDCEFPVSANVNGAILTFLSELEALKSLLKDIGVRLANDEEGKRLMSLARDVDIQVGKALAKYAEPEGAAGTSKGTKSMRYRVHDDVQFDEKVYYHCRR